MHHAVGDPGTAILTTQGRRVSNQLFDSETEALRLDVIASLLYEVELFGGTPLKM